MYREGSGHPRSGSTQKPSSRSQSPGPVGCTGGGLVLTFVAPSVSQPSSVPDRPVTHKVVLTKALLFRLGCVRVHTGTDL